MLARGERSEPLVRGPLSSLRPNGATGCSESLGDERNPWKESSFQVSATGGRKPTSGVGRVVEAVKGGRDCSTSRGEGTAPSPLTFRWASGRKGPAVAALLRSGDCPGKCGRMGMSALQR